MDREETGIDIDSGASVKKNEDVDYSNNLEFIDDIESTGGIKPVKYNRVFTKSNIAWIVFFLIGVAFSIYCYFVPLQFTIDLSQGVGWKAVLSFVSICAVKYIWMISLLCIFFTFKRKDNPNYFSFIVGFYILLLIFCVIGVVI